MFVPPINIGQFQPSPATLADWIYQIWNYLQNNPIATQEQLQEYIATFITTSPETQTLIGEGVEQYLTDNPPHAPVQSVQGKTGAVSLTYPDIVPASNAVPVYRAGSAPNTSTAQGLYNNGYRLFVNTATQEIYTISNSGALALVGRGKFDGTTVDLNTAQGDTTIAEAINDLIDANSALSENIAAIQPQRTFITASSAVSAGQYTEIARLTASEDGVYLLNGVCRFEQSSGSDTMRDIAIRFNVNGQDYSPALFAKLSNTWSRYCVFDVAPLAAGNVVIIKAYSNLAVSDVSADLTLTKI